MLRPALGLIGDLFAAHPSLPFGLVEQDFIDYALQQFQKRLDRLERARHASLADIYRITQSAIDQNDA